MFHNMDMFFFGIILFVFHSAIGENCVFHSPCSCSTDSYKIDLSPMMKKNSDPLTTSYLGAKYYLDPCGKSLKVPACNSLGPEASGCQLEGGNYAYGIARTTGYTASGDPAKGTVTFTYSYASGSQKRTTKLKIECSSKERELKCEGEHPTLTYNFVLHTKYGCKHIPSSDDSGGLSTGSILVILFFVFLLIYIIGGVLFLKYYRNEQGIALIPNREFWMELPLLMKDGVVFVIAKVRGDTSYDKI